MKSLIGFALLLNCLSVSGALADSFNIGPAPGYPQQTIYLDCSSNSDHFTRCQVNGSIAYARLVHQMSHSACNEGQSWGYEQNAIWVDRGCRASFEVSLNSYGPPPVHSQTLDCSSNSDHYTQCSTNLQITQAQVESQFSHSDCTEGHSWGFSGNVIWVDRGCRARFRVWGY